MNKQKERKLVLLFSAITVLLLFASEKLREKETKPDKLSASIEISLASPPLSYIEIEGKAGYVVDLDTRAVLFEKNADNQLPLASLTKVMTAVVGADLLSPNEDIAINGRAIAEEGDSGMTEGEKWKIDELINFTLVSSSNDGAAAIMEAAERKRGVKFREQMNVKGKELGLNQTYFTNATGLDLTGSQGGSYGSSRDMARLLAYILIYKPDILEATKETVYLTTNNQGKTYAAKNTNNGLSTHIPGFIASKTGYTELAGGNLMMAFDRGLAQPVAIVIMGSSQEGRFRDAEKLRKAIVDYFNSPQMNK